MKKDNKGFSLVELIVVIAIIGIMATLAVTSIGPLISQRASNAASSANSLISKCKVFSMGREGEVYVRIYKAADGNVLGEYWENGALIETEILGGGSVQVSPESTFISFKRATGGLRIFGASQGNAAPNSGSCTISFSSAGKTYDVVIIASTGKHEVVRND